MLVPTFCRYLRYPQVFCLLGLDFFFLSFFLYFLYFSFFLYFLYFSFFSYFLSLSFLFSNFSLTKESSNFLEVSFPYFSSFFFCSGRVNDDATCSCFNCHFSWYFSSLIMPEQPDVIQSCTYE